MYLDLDNWYWYWYLLVEYLIQDCSLKPIYLQFYN